MDALQADLLRDLDPVVLGQRLRAERLGKGLTQGELAGDDVSIAYVSRIESGQRRPNLKVLESLAKRLDVAVEQLLRGIAPRQYDEIRLSLDYAELSLESGQPHEAEARAQDALEKATAAGLHDMAQRAHYLHARSMEDQGQIDDAILELENLIAEADAFWQLKAGISLSRCFRDSGDLARAIETGERILELVHDTGLDSSDEAVQLAVTVAAAFFERGDVGQAVRVCRRAVEKAETLGSPTARASAYWNASMMQAERGAVAEAVPLAERALALLGEGNDARNLARLRTQLGAMQLRLDPPELDEAQVNLGRAAEELAWSSAAPVDVARNDLALARAHFLAGESDSARDLCDQVFAVSDQAPLLAADAHALQGQARAAEGDTVGATAAYREAVLLLTRVGADRNAAQLWFELAALLEDVGDFDGARDAYRSAAASAGLVSRPAARVTVPQH